jgi:uncharacterized protein (TIGR02145 family)
MKKIFALLFIGYASIYAQLPNYLNPNLTYGSVTDVDGNTYATIAIGTQVWMAENLRTTKFNNGDQIQNIADDNQWVNTTNAAWTYYDNFSLYENPYGKLYNYYAVTDSRYICPMGWHVPIDAEWTFLTNYLGGLSIAGGKMKSTGITYWNTPNEGATNESGFSGLPSGLRSFTFYDIGTNARFWSATISGGGSVIIRRLYKDYKTIGREFESSEYTGLSIRCLNDFPNSINKNNDDINLNLKTYPNIAEDFINVEYTLNEKENITISLLNIEGKPIKVFGNENQIAGFKRIFLDVTDIPSGIYMLKITGNRTNAHTKIIKQ